MIQADKILFEPIVSEKAAAASSHLNQYTFKVAKTANRVMVAQAVEKALGKTVTNVRIINVKPKAKPSRTRRGGVAFRSGYKKAIITLKAGETLELV